jgi:hypothetical protein
MTWVPRSVRAFTKGRPTSPVPPATTTRLRPTVAMVPPGSDSR